MKTKSICAVIPAKYESKRVPLKNISPFGESNLLVRKIRQLLLVVEKVYVSSESEIILKMAAEEGASPLIRDSKFSMDETPMSEVYVYIAESINEETVLFTHVTNPFCGSETYERCIDSYMGASDFDSLTTVNEVKEFLYWDGKAINFDPSKKPRSQDLPNIVKLNHAVSILPRKLIIEQKNIIGKNPKFLVLSQIESIDIDTNFDFEISKLIAKEMKI